MKVKEEHLKDFLEYSEQPEPTILVLAANTTDAIDIVRYLKPFSNIGDIKKVDY